MLPHDHNVSSAFFLKLWRGKICTKKPTCDSKCTGAALQVKTLSKKRTLHTTTRKLCVLCNLTKALICDKEPKVESFCRLWRATWIVNDSIDQVATESFMHVDHIWGSALHQPSPAKSLVHGAWWHECHFDHFLLLGCVWMFSPSIPITIRKCYS